MPLRLAFDMDGVFAEMEGELVRLAEELFAGKSPRRASDPAPPEAGEESDAAAADTTPNLARLQLTSRQQRRLWRHVETVDNFWETLQEIEPGSIARLAELALERRWE